MKHQVVSTVWVTKDKVIHPLRSGKTKEPEVAAVLVQPRSLGCLPVHLLYEKAWGFHQATHPNCFSIPVLNSYQNQHIDLKSQSKLTAFQSHIHFAKSHFFDSFSAAFNSSQAVPLLMPSVSTILGHASNRLHTKMPKFKKGYYTAICCTYSVQKTRCRISEPRQSTWLCAWHPPSSIVRFWLLLRSGDWVTKRKVPKT